MNERLRQRLLQVFQAEHADHLSIIRHFLDKAAAGDYTPQDLNKAFRRAHSLKGAARAVDLGTIEQLAHHVETLFSRVQSQEITLNAAVIKTLHQVLDFCEDWVSAQFQQTPAPDPNPPRKAIETLLGLNPEPTVPAEPPAPPVAPASEASSESGSEDKNPLRLGETGNDEQMRISAQRLESLLESSDRLNAESQQQNLISQKLDQLAQQLTHLDTSWQSCQPHIQQPFLRERFAQDLRELNDLLRETRLMQQQSAWSFSQEIRLLQHAMRETRMQPARYLFQTFPKMLRRLAQEQGKEIHCHFSGLEIEADRAILQAIKDPVMHLLRNAVAHGIELPDERRKKGKKPVGQVSCQLEVRRHQLVVRIGDDGQGLNQERIREILQEKAPETLERSDWQDVIFQPGFSTASGVNELRGRGMGLSVVAESMAQLQGRCHLLPQEQGLGFELEVPLHIVTYRLLLFSCQEHIFALPANSVQQLLRLNRDEIQNLDGQPVLKQADQPIPFYSLGHLLFGQTASNGEHLSVLLLHAAQRQMALQVDKLLADQESLLRPMTGPAATLPLYLGAVLSAQGQAIPVLNPQYLLQLSDSSGSQRQNPFKQRAQVQRARILVVDDSITTRTLEKSILETQGYRVAVAVNGREALRKLRESPFDLLISDVQMPEMDGLELLEAVKQDPHLSQIPVIMLTSLNAVEDQTKGLELGAEAYLVKQKFEQQELLEVIEQLL